MEPGVLVILVVAAYVTSTVSGFIGMAGGMMLLTLMYAVGMPPELAIPIHACVQLVSNSTRTLVLFRHVRWGPFLCVAIAALPFPYFGLKLLALVDGAWSLLAVVSVIGLFLFSSAVLLGALGLDIAPRELHSSVTAAQFLTGMGLGSAAPVIAGAVAAVAGTAATFYVATVMFGVTLAIVLVLPSTKGSTPTPRFVAR